jgi:hypothetical protein
MIPTPPKLIVVVRVDGTVEDVAVLAREPVGRAEGADLLNKIQPEIADFERAVAERLRTDRRTWQ